MTINSKFKKIFYNILEESSKKFDAKKFQKIVDYLFTLSEKLIIRLDYFLPFYVNYYSNLVEEEIKLAGIIESTKVLHVGSGSIPSTPILIAKKTKAKITGIDNDLKAIKNSRKCIKKLDLTNYIDIKKIDAMDISIKDFGLILISHGIVPKKLFLENLSKKISKENIIILRSFSKNSNLESEDLFLKDIFTIENIIDHKKNGSVISIKLSKK